MKIPIFGKILQGIIHFEWISLFDICNLQHFQKTSSQKLNFPVYMSNSSVLFCEPCDSNVLGKLELNVIDIYASFYRRKSKLQPHCQFLLEFGNAWARSHKTLARQSKLFWEHFRISSIQNKNLSLTWKVIYTKRYFGLKKALFISKTFTCDSSGYRKKIYHVSKKLVSLSQFVHRASNAMTSPLIITQGVSPV